MRWAPALPSEYAPSSKSADEIRGLWQWVEARLNSDLPDRELLAGEDESFAIMLRPMATPDAGETPVSQPLPAWEETNASWDTGL
jgi:hypothetical protein